MIEVYVILKSRESRRAVSKTCACLLRYSCVRKLLLIIAKVDTRLQQSLKDA